MVMITELSILIPTYNSVAYPTAKKLYTLCERIAMDAPHPFRYEIIVADDGSEDSNTVDANQAINFLGNSRFIVKSQNSGSAATRNFLAQQSQYEWLLFIDSDMEIPGMDYIMRYLPCDQTDVTNGGIKVGGSWETHHHNLRYIYEKDSEPAHTVDKRQAVCFREFRSTNFLIRRACMLAHPFDERFKKSGYEDVFLGKTLHDAGATIMHINNPLILNDFEDNETFVRKTERNMMTLYHFRKELKGYSRLIDNTNSLTAFLLQLWHHVFGRLERHNLTSRHPRLWVYTLYRVGFFCSLKD